MSSIFDAWFQFHCISDFGWWVWMCISLRTRLPIEEQLKNISLSAYRCITLKRRDTSHFSYNAENVCFSFHTPGRVMISPLWSASHYATEKCSPKPLWCGLHNSLPSLGHTTIIIGHINIKKKLSNQLSFSKKNVVFESSNKNTAFFWQTSASLKNGLLYWLQQFLISYSSTFFLSSTPIAIGQQVGVTLLHLLYRYLVIQRL